MEETEQQPELRLTKAKLLGFDNLSYDSQRVIFNKARMFGWRGDEPSVLGSEFATKCLDEAIEYLLKLGVKFQKER